MKKDTRLTFRVQSELKKTLEALAAKEGRSVAQMCEAFLKAGVEEFKKKGPRYLQQFLSRSRQERL
jgi:predicted DNA-binding protein